MRNVFSFVLFLVLQLGVFAQTVVGDIREAKLIETSSGFLVYGLSETALEIDCYDKQLNLQQQVRKELPAGGASINGVYVQGDEIRFETKWARLIMDDKGKLKEYITWDKAQRKLDKKKVKSGSYENYVPQFNGHVMKVMATGLEAGISHKGKHYEVTWEYGKSPLILENISIRCFQARRDNVWYNYVQEWQLELKHQTLKNIKWYNLGDEYLYLYISERSKQDNHVFLYKVDVENQRVVYRHKVNLDQYQVPAFSNMLLCSGGDLIVVGSYQNSMPKEWLSNSMDGWFILRLNDEGKEVSKKVYDQHVFYPNDKGRFFLSFQDIHVLEENRFGLIVEHMRFVTTEANSGSEPQRTYTVSHAQSYGHSVLVLDEAFNLLERDYVDHLQTSKGYKEGYHLFSVPQFDVFHYVMAHEPFYQYPGAGIKFIYYNLRDCSWQGNQLRWLSISGSDYKWFQYEEGGISQLRDFDEKRLKDRTETKLPWQVKFLSHDTVLMFDSTLPSGYQLEVVAI